MYYIRWGNASYKNEDKRLYTQDELEIALDKTDDAYYEDMLGPNFDEHVTFAELIHKPTGDVVKSIQDSGGTEPTVYQNEHYIPAELRE